MPRYYLNLFNDVDTTDEEGCDYADLAEARNGAIEAARALIAEHVTKAQPIDLGDRIEVTDGQGVVLATIRFREVVTITDRDAAD
ncbi:hypothetical protein MZO42_11815 [Sphingomonas psychrotolerans]|uniref:DUF6894 domain-containing protein n=1 Tax=Sphingomonas psychrotolerans TaxID=1327635 RepID=A0ABU3N4C1_9SPHN|nr:hypothetical protein [Sphingomonas psychrotolerans]MDT8759385.1 hypothetical protein [Sphingomonas psychrotolerans]